MGKIIHLTEIQFFYIGYIKKIAMILNKLNILQNDFRQTIFNDATN